MACTSRVYRRPLERKRARECTPNATLFTLDSDFGIYRQKGRRLIPLLAP